MWLKRIRAQNIVVSNKWGFTNLTKEEFTKFKDEGRLLYNGIYAKVRSATGKLNDDSILTFTTKSAAAAAAKA